MEQQMSEASNPITKLTVQNFTTFADLALEPSTGINVFVGTNGTGKTHLLKLMYSVLTFPYGDSDGLAAKLIRVFRPESKKLGRLVRRGQGPKTAKFVLMRGEKSTTRAKWDTRSDVDFDSVSTKSSITLGTVPPATYIPVKEMLAHAPGFRSLYSTYDLPFEEVYRDIIDRALFPLVRGKADTERATLLAMLRKKMSGNVSIKNEQFYLNTVGEGSIEFSLVSEGWRKIALLWLLIQNQTLSQGSFLFWDEPEANLNPSMQETVANVLIELQRRGVQIFVASHDYVFLKQLELLRKESDKVRYHLFQRSSQKAPVTCSSFESYDQISENLIEATLDDIYEKNILKALGVKSEGN